MGSKTTSQFKRHKKYRWIALFAKILLSPVFALAFAKITPTLFPKGSQTIGHFLATLCALIIYYGIIFFLNRYHNFKTKNDLYKTLTIYIVVVVFLMVIESLTSGALQNMLYNLCKLGYTGETLTVATANHKGLYLLFGLAVQFSFSFVTGIIIFLLYKYVLTNKRLIDKI